MCMEDIRIGRKKITAVSTKTTGAGGDAILVAASEKRVHLTVHTGGGPLAIAPSDFPTASGNGFFSVAGTLPPFDMDIETHGDIVTKEWRFSGIGGSTTVIIVETFLEDK